jgi:anti-sigma B factor antagonist
MFGSTRVPAMSARELKGGAGVGFGLKIEQLSEEVVRIALSGELDMTRAYTFDEELRAVEAHEPSCICLDLSGVTFVDSSGLARIVAARRRAQRAGRRLVLVRGPAPVQRLLAMAALDQQFEMISDARSLLSS